MLCNYSLNYFILSRYKIPLSFNSNHISHLFSSQGTLSTKTGDLVSAMGREKFCSHPLFHYFLPFLLHIVTRLILPTYGYLRRKKIFTVKTAMDKNVLEDVLHLSFIPSSSTRGLRIICRTWVGSRRGSIKRVGLDSLQGHLNQTKNSPTAYTPLPSTAAYLSDLSAAPY